MSREIKFRLRDKDINKFVPEHAYLLANDSRQIAVCKRGWEGVAPGEIWYDQHCVLEQFTGLLDKNGKEIYEGDIVAYKYQAHGTFRFQCEVMFGDWTDEKSLDTDSRHIGFYLRGQEDNDDYWYTDFPSDSVKMEVIGNIHANPELLKETTQEESE